MIRAGREIDHGWFFLGGKRRENYDDWWRCEIQFDPVLDEAFGITHTKQQIRPSTHLIEALSPDMEAMARTLSNRARKAHKNAKLAGTFQRFGNTCERKGQNASTALLASSSARQTGLGGIRVEMRFFFPLRRQLRAIHDLQNRSDTAQRNYVLQLCAWRGPSAGGNQP